MYCIHIYSHLNFIYVDSDDNTCLYPDALTKVKHLFMLMQMIIPVYILILWLKLNIQNMLMYLRKILRQMVLALKNVLWLTLIRPMVVCVIVFWLKLWTVLLSWELPVANLFYYFLMITPSYAPLFKKFFNNSWTV